MENSLTFQKLVKAYLDCRKRKRKTKSAIAFEINQEENLIKLYDELVNGTYQISESICFIVLYPKPREVWAACFRDRIVHHLIYNEISERFYRRFIKDTYSCIPERGITNAVKALRKYARTVTNNYTETAYYLKADLRNFFVSIDKDILYTLISKYVDEDWLLKLIKQVIYHDCKSKVYIRSAKWKFDLLPDYKSLWHTVDGKGLPIGNLTSQFFSNVYLNVLDQYVKHHWHCKFYCRYVDDFVIMDKNPHKLNSIHKDLTKFLKNKLELDLHQHKKSINKIERGIDFVGFVEKPHRTILRTKTLKRIFKIVQRQRDNPDWFTPQKLRNFVNTMNSYLGILRNTNSYNFRKNLCAHTVNLFISCDIGFTKLKFNFAF